MKKRILFSAFFTAALFSACTSDELLNEGIGETGKDVEGAELLSKGLSFGVASTNGTRIAGGEWENGDCAGLAWFVKGNYGDQQSYDYLTKGNDLGDKLAVNHRFFYNKDEQMFQSNSNVYVGWHMAYYPYSWKGQSFQTLTMGLNDVPQTVEDCMDDRLASMPAISAKDFLNERKINKADGTLTSKFTMFGVALQLKPTLQPTSEFTGNDLLKELKVKKVTVKNNSPVFADGIQVVPSKVPAFVYGSTNGLGVWAEGADDGSNTYSADKTNELFNDANLIAPTKAVVPTGSVREISRAIDCDAIKLDAAHEVNVFFNAIGTLNKANLTVEVEVEQGKFILPYIAEGTSAYNALTTSDKNYQNQINAAFEKIAEHLAKSVFIEPGKNRGALTCALPLSKKHFTPDFTDISDIDDWNRAVNLVDALGLEDPTFSITGNIECDGEIPMPNGVDVLNVISTAGKAIVVKGDNVNYPSKLNTNSTVSLTVDGTLNVTSEETVNVLTVNDGATLNIAVNSAKIVAKETRNAGNINIAPRGTLQVDELTNQINYPGTGIVEGVIDITYGAYVKAANLAVPGTIQYTVKNDTKAYQINNLIKAVDPTARVNTLVVPTGITLDLNLKDNDVEDDPYNSTVVGEMLADLSEVNIILDGGTLTNTNASLKTVANIVARSGDSHVNMVKASDVTVDEGATLTVKADVNKTGALVNGLIQTITNKGTLNFASDLVDDDGEGENVDFSYVEVATSITNNGAISVKKVHITTPSITNNEGATLTAKSADSAQVRSTSITNDGIITGDVKN